jgi:hypothetical protein
VCTLETGAPSAPAGLNAKNQRNRDASAPAPAPIGVWAFAEHPPPPRQNTPPPQDRTCSYECDWHHWHARLDSHTECALLEPAKHFVLAAGAFGEEQHACACPQHLNARLQALELAAAINAVQLDVTCAAHSEAKQGASRQQLRRFVPALPSSCGVRRRLQVSVPGRTRNTAPLPAYAPATQRRTRMLPKEVHTGLPSYCMRPR